MATVFKVPSGSWAPLVLVGFLLVASTAHAESAEVEDLIRQANELRRQKKDADAFPLLQKAHALGSTARTAAQLGLVEYNLGYWLDAEAHLVSSLAARLDPWVHQNRPVLEQTLARTRAAIGEIEVAGTPVGAEVFVNGRRVGQLPLAAPVRAGDGPATIEVRAPGHIPDKRSITVRGRLRQDVTVNLQRQPNDAAAATSSVATQTTPAALAPPVEGSLPVLEGTKDTHPAAWARPTAWALSAAALAGLGFGIFEAVVWRRRVSDFDGHRSTTGVRDCGLDDPARGGPGCAAIYSDMNRARTLAITGYVTGGLLAAGSVTLFLLSSDRANQSAAACYPSAVALVATCRFRF